MLMFVLHYFMCVSILRSQKAALDFQELGIVLYAYNPSSQKVEAGRFRSSRRCLAIYQVLGRQKLRETLSQRNQKEHPEIKIIVRYLKL